MTGGGHKDVSAAVSKQWNVCITAPKRCAVWVGVLEAFDLILMLGSASSQLQSSSGRAVKK